MGPGRTISLTGRNLSSVSAESFSRLRTAFEAELVSHGTSIANESEGDATLLFALSENLAQYLLVAEVEHDGSRQVVIVASDKPSLAGTEAARATVALQSQLVWSQQEPIVDFALAKLPGSAEQLLLVLEPNRVALYALRDSRWGLAHAVPLPIASPLPRDLRGRISVREGLFSVLLPGLECSGTVHQTRANPQLDFVCDSSDGWWEFTAPGSPPQGGLLVAGRNFFQPLSPSGPSDEGAFYSVAPLRQGESAYWLYSGTDGITRLVDSDARVVATFSGWGAQLTAVQSDCTTGWLVLATGADDWTLADGVRAFEMVGSRATPASAPLAFPGPILVLAPGEDLRTTRAVIRNLDTGDYEAHLLTLACTR